MTSVGMCAKTGKVIYGDDCINQAIRRLLSTQHDLVFRRHLAADISPLVDEPGNPYTFAKMRSAMAGAILNGEPRVDLKTIDITSPEPGLVQVTLTAISRESGQTLAINWPEQTQKKTLA